MRINSPLNYSEVEECYIYCQGTHVGRNICSNLRANERFSLMMLRAASNLSVVVWLEVALFVYKIQ
jgi:hypothetical protein